MTTPILHVTVGIPGSGKTTHCQELIAENPDLVYVSRDRMRDLHCQKGYAAETERVLKEIIYATLRLHLLEGRSVVYDATNARRSDVTELSDLSLLGGADIEYHVLHCALETAIERRRGIVPEEAIRRIHAGWLLLPALFLTGAARTQISGGTVIRGVHTHDQADAHDQAAVD